MFATCGVWYEWYCGYFNASRSVEVKPERYVKPTTIAEISEAIRSSKKVHVVGKGHSFNRCIETAGTMIDLTDFNKVLSLDKTRNVVTVEAGIMILDLCDWLYKRGYELTDLPGYICQTLGGAINTGTHGTVRGRGSWTTTFESAIVSLLAVDGRGGIFKLPLEDVVLCDSFSMIVRVSIKVRPLTWWRYVYEQSSLDQLSNQKTLERMIEDLAYPDININKERRAIVEYLVRSRGAGSSWELSGYLGRRVTGGEIFPRLLDNPFVPMSKRDGVAGRLKNSYRVASHGRIYSPSIPFFIANSSQYSVRSLQMEWAIPFERTAEALAWIRDGDIPSFYNILIRFQGPPRSKMNPGAGLERSTYIHITTLGGKNDYAALNEAMMELGARPHWGKWFSMSSEYLSQHYDFAAYRALLHKHDPESKLLNAHMQNLLP
jgi:xylitol oxidase